MPSRRLVVEIDPELHRRIRIIVSKKDTSIKAWIIPILMREVEKEEALNGHTDA
jgi:predicted HicB family RNase H-like nuclease